MNEYKFVENILTLNGILKNRKEVLLLISQNLPQIEIAKNQIDNGTFYFN